MAADDPSRSSRKWHELDLYLRSIDLEAHFLKDVVAGRESLVRRMNEIHGPTLPARVKSRIDKAMAIDPARKAETLARLYRAEVRRNLELELQASGETALAGQIKNSIVMHEEKYGLRIGRSSQERRAEDKRIHTAAQALAHAREVFERHPTPGLEAAIARWTEILATGAATARHFARLPLAKVHDVDLYMLVSGSPAQREQAVQNLIAGDFLPVGGWLSDAIPGRSRAKAELNSLRDERGHVWVYEWLKNVILPAALILAADDVKDRERVRIRLGARWVLDLDGRQALVEPWELNDDELASWLRVRVLDRVEEGVHGDQERPGPAPIGLENPVAGAGGPGGSDPEDRARLVDTLPATEFSPEDRILQMEEGRRIRIQLSRFLDHFSSLPEADQKLLALHADDRRYEELAGILGATPEALRKRVERLKRGLRGG